jgi:two-component system, NarL family, invasion response regulator UvrY
VTGTPVQTAADRQRDVGVLVVDDQLAFRNAASAVIQFTPGFRLVGQVGSGEEAIEFVNQHAPALVLLDVHMPKLGGVATARAIARSRRSTFTVLMSADKHPEIAADPRAHGAAAFLPKDRLGPRTLRELWATRNTCVTHRDRPGASDQP